MSRARWIAVLSFLLCVSIAAPVLADSPPPEGSPPETLPEASHDAELTQLPTNQDMANTLGRFEAEEEKEREALENPAAIREREASQSQYSEIDASQAEQLLGAAFGPELQALNAEPARFFSAARLIRPLGKGGALVESEGRNELIEGTAPVRISSSEGTPGKINLKLEEAGNGYEPANPLVELGIPSVATEGVEVGDEGVAISQAGAQESAARPFGEMNVFYPEVQTDTDLLVSPVATGVEFFDQLRSEESPETLRFHVQMPAGAQLRSNASGAEVIGANGSKLADVPPPTAVDAQGAEVPVQMHSEGESLVLDVERSEGEFAYPILVDPIIQEWYWQNWYEGYNLQALSDGAWQWNTSEGPASSYVYGSTSCIYSCWGSGRGLYMDTPNGNLPANRWGQWSYSAPNSETYLENAWVSPFWRDNHVNCPQSKYGQPYDYDGMWNETSWNRILYNQANEQGWSDIESWGRAFIVGMGTSSGISIPCWRDVMAGGTRIWLEDWSRPNLYTSSTGQWMDQTPVRLNVSAYDAGLGVQKFQATATNAGGGTEEWWTASACTGLYEAPCPHTWNLGEASQPQLSYSPANLPEGIDTLHVTAYDAAQKPSFTTNEMTVRVDHSAPMIALSGTLTEQARVGTELPSYTVDARAEDGNPYSENPTEARSGVVKLEFEVDGQPVAQPFTPKCAGEANCGAEEELMVPALELTPGTHTLVVRATDALGHIATHELKFTISPDTTAPELTQSGMPAILTPTYTIAYGGAGSGPGNLSGPTATATDKEGNVWVADNGHNRVQEFNSKGEFLQQFGGPGTGPGQLSGMKAIAIGPSGNLYVAERTRIQEFNPKGEFLRQWGSEGTGNGQFAELREIAIDPEGHVWAIDRGEAVNKIKPRLQEFNAEGTFIAKLEILEGTGAGQLKNPGGMAIDAAGDFWFADTPDNRIEEFKPNGEYLRVVGSEGTGNGQLKGPMGIAVDASGNIWVADTGNDRLESFSSTGAYLSQFGKAGDNEGQFSAPKGLSVDASGDIWVADTNNNRIEELAAGEYLRQAGGAGSGPGQLSGPTATATDKEGNVWVADNGHARIQEFNSKGEFLQQFGGSGSGPGQFGSMKALAIGPAGNLYVGERTRIQEFNSKGEFLRQWGSEGTANGQFAELRTMAIDPEGHVWAIDRGEAVNKVKPRLQEFSPEGAYIAKLEIPEGSGWGQLNRPSGMAIDRNGNFWFADTSNNRIEELGPNGEFLQVEGTEGSGEAQLKEPSGIALDDEGNIWVADTGNDRVVEFNPEGIYLSQFGKAGDNAGQFSAPKGLSLDAAGNTWVADTNNNRIEELAAGEYVRQAGGAGSGPGQLSEPNAPATDKEGNVWVADNGHHRVQEFNPKGEFLQQFGAAGTGPGQFGAMKAIAIGPAGNLYVAERTRVQEFNPKGEFLRQWGSEGTGNGQFGEIRTMTVDFEGHVWTLDKGEPLTKMRLQEFTSEGTFIAKLEIPEGTGAGQLKNPGGMAIDAAGDFWFADTPDNRIEEFKPNGEYLRAVGSEGSGNGQLREPRDLAIDPAGQVWVDDTGNDRIEIFSSVGAYLSQFGKAGDNAGQFSRPMGLSLDAKGNIWVADTGNDRIEEWATQTLAVGRGLEMITAHVTDAYSGATLVAVRLTNEARQSLLLEQRAQACSYGGCSLNATFEHLDLSEEPPGRYVLTLEAKDGAGNSTSISRNFTLDPGPPEISLSGTLAERAGLPLDAPSGELRIAASETDLPSSGVKTINVELDHQRVATHSFNCSSDCQEVEASYVYDAQRDGADRSLETPAAPTGATLTSLGSVSCASANDCQVVGYYKNANGTVVTLAEHWNGAEWQVEPSPNPAGALESRLEGVSCTSASSCTAVGYDKTGSEAVSAFAESWNGSEWALTPIPNPTGFAKAYLYSVSCGAVSDCWAVGKEMYKASEEIEGKKPSALLEHWNGSGWTQTSLVEAPAQLKGVSCASASLCIAVTGQSGLTADSWNGTGWASQTLAKPSGSGGTLKAVSCNASTACTIVGSYNSNGHTAPLAESWNGSSWSVEPTVDPVGVIEEVRSSSLESVACPSMSACTAVGVRSTSHETLPLVESWRGASEWALEPAAVPSGTETASLTSVACSGAFECTSVGSHITSATQALIEAEGGSEAGDQILTVEAVDTYGNAQSKSIAVDVPEEIGNTPECGQEATSVTPEGIVNPAEAAGAIEESLPTAVASSIAGTDEINGKELDPSYSPPKPNLESERSLAESETSVDPTGGFTLNGIACVTPAQTTSAATEAKVIEGDAAIFANTAPETDTVMRPTTYGTAVIQSLRGADAPTSYSWNVQLNPDEKLVELPSGAVAVTEAGSEGGEGVEVPPAPEGMHTAQALNSATVQLEVGEYEVAKAEAETPEVVLAVIARPWVVLRQESIMPLDLRVEPDKEIPTEYTVTYVMPPFEPNFTPEAVVTEATASASAIVNGRCLEGTPCGTFDANAAAQYAEYWGNPNHDRNTYYHDFKEDNCTNFLSQIMARGGMSFMRAFEHVDGSWWYERFNFPQYPEAPRPAEWTESWVEADLLPRHLWQYGLADIDSSNEPSGWTKGDILAENWYRDGKGTFNHLQFVVGTEQLGSRSREPLIANESGPGDNYSHMIWYEVKKRIEQENPEGWNRVPLTVKHTIAVYGAPGAKKHDPANLYGPNGVFQG